MKKLVLLLSVLAIALLAACGGEQAEEATDNGDSSAGDAEATEAIEVTITNGLGEWDIHSVLLDPSNEPWGDERLDEEQVLAPGEVVTIEVEEGTWDLMVTDEDGDTYTLWQIDIGPEGYEWNVTLDDMDSGWEDESMEPQLLETGEGEAYVSIVNDLEAWDIYYVRVDPTDEPWGEDRLGANILTPGDELMVWVDPGTYDIQVEDEDGDTYTLWEVELDEAGYDWFVTLEDLDPMTGGEEMGGAALETGDGTAPVTIVNDLGGWDIYFAYVDPSDAPWGDDRLGADILSQSDQITVLVEPGTYDMRVEDEDGDAYTVWGVDVDETGHQWTVTLDDMD